LRDVAGATQNRYKASALGAYERGERSISLARFQELAEFYGQSADRLLAEVLEELDPLGREKLVIDLERLRLVGEYSGTSSRTSSAVSATSEETTGPMSSHSGRAISRSLRRRRQ